MTDNLPLCVTIHVPWKMKKLQISPIRPTENFVQRKKTYILYIDSFLTIEAHLFTEVKAMSCHAVQCHMQVTGNAQ